MDSFRHKHKHKKDYTYKHRPDRTPKNKTDKINKTNKTKRNETKHNQTNKTKQNKTDKGNKKQLEPTKTRLDRIYVPKPNKTTYETTILTPPLKKEKTPHTDHQLYMIKDLELKGLSQPKRGPGNWQLNVQILRDEDYRSQIINAHTATKSDRYPNNLIFWDCLKAQYSQISIKKSLLEIERKISQTPRKPLG